MVFRTKYSSRFFASVFVAGLSAAALALSMPLGAPAYADSMQAAPGLSLGIASIPNLRDLGGYKTADGMTVKKGFVYRANQLSGISDDDMKKFAALGLKTAFDLRTQAEIDKRPDELPDGVKYVSLDVLSDLPESGAAQLEVLLTQPKKANEVLGGGKAAEEFGESYRAFVSLPSARKEFRELYLAFADEKQVPALFHCTTGKDRTGWAAAAFLTLLGVPKETVYEDYLRSNDYIVPKYQSVIDSFVAAGGEAEIPEAIIALRKEYLDIAFDEMETKYGTIQNYFTEALGIGPDQQQALRDFYLVK